MITLDDANKLKDFGLISLQSHDHPMTPGFDRNTMHIPGRAGLWDFGTETKEKYFNLPLGLIEYDRITLQQKLNNFVAFLYDDFGQPREIKMVFDYEPGKFYTVKLATQITPERMIHAGRFNLPFVANDPYKYSNVYEDEVLWGSKVITFEYHYLLGHTNELGGSVKVTGPKKMNVTNSGIAVQPIFEIEGTANNLKIECGKYSFTLPNFSNTKWIIDFEKYVVFKNGKDTMIEIREFYLMPGDNAVEITGSNINIDLRIKYRDKYN